MATRMPLVMRRHISVAGSVAVAYCTAQTASLIVRGVGGVLSFKSLGWMCMYGFSTSAQQTTAAFAPASMHCGLEKGVNSEAPGMTFSWPAEQLACFDQTSVFSRAHPANFASSCSSSVSVHKRAPKSLHLRMALLNVMLLPQGSRFRGPLALAQTSSRPLPGPQPSSAHVLLEYRVGSSHVFLTLGSNTSLIRRSCTSTDSILCGVGPAPHSTG
mmetsp:Transcript_118044/g.235148  ORF Transcript_118044/g.235148 Transcript_118044/m.235148 type:complete len:215 (-) Transcript_118044:3857-4501(-)